MDPTCTPCTFCVRSARSVAAETAVESDASSASLARTPRAKKAAATKVPRGRQAAGAAATASEPIFVDEDEVFPLNDHDLRDRIVPGGSAVLVRTRLIFLIFYHVCCLHGRPQTLVS